MWGGRRPRRGCCCAAGGGLGAYDGSKSCGSELRHAERVRHTVLVVKDGRGRSALWLGPVKHVVRHACAALCAWGMHQCRLCSLCRSSALCLVAMNKMMSAQMKRSGRCWMTQTNSVILDIYAAVPSTTLSQRVHKKHPTCLSMTPRVYDEPPTGTPCYCVISLHERSTKVDNAMSSWSWSPNTMCYAT